MEIIIPLVVIFGAFYFMLLRPVLQQQRRQRRDIAHLRVGDRVLTQGGFIATVHDIRIPEEGPTEIILDLGSGVLVTALASAISRRLEPSSQAQREPDREQPEGAEG